MCDDDQLPDREDGTSGGDVVPFRRPDNVPRTSRNPNADLLQKVTTALGLPADHFHTALGKDPQAGGAATRESEQDALLQAFDGIQDPIMRRHLVKLVRTLSGGVDNDSEQQG